MPNYNDYLLRNIKSKNDTMILRSSNVSMPPNSFQLSNISMLVMYSALERRLNFVIVDRNYVFIVDVGLHYIR
ncbi:hypothetical protein T01_13644 [Trichinella spiralis]|uniref:Uncharacterized protein n=1 Tax=Trichinella spiralis TaxID=6334 RepID=A0A0V1AWS8_TRISP|nr:hypothetical protein T01_13644 [Trichinella spiralis]